MGDQTFYMTPLWEFRRRLNRTMSQQGLWADLQFDQAYITVQTDREHGAGVNKAYYLEFVL